MTKEPTPPAPLGSVPASDASLASAISAERATKQRGAGGVGLIRFLHLLTLLTLFSLWTWKLLDPTPVPEQLSSKLKGDVRLAAAKSLHAVGYAVLTLLAVTLPVSRRWRWVFALLLAAHGVGTEIGQTFVGRTGRVWDVLIDWAGIALGVLIWRVVLVKVYRSYNR